MVPVIQASGSPVSRRADHRVEQRLVAVRAGEQLLGLLLGGDEAGVGQPFGEIHEY